VILYQAVRGLIQVVAKLFWRVGFEGKEHVPADGAFVLAPVHRSFIDFGLVSGVTRRKLRYMGKESLWRSRALGWFITTLGAFPVNRGTADRESYRRSLDILRGGEPLVLFPEGTRRRGPVVEHLSDGAAHMASQAGAPIVPVGIGGSERALPKGKRLPRPVKIQILVGPPLMPPPVPEGKSHPSRRAVHDLTLELQATLQDLFERAQKKAGAPVNAGQRPIVQ
jgi:1-acyl-sn-glycerol-3-phosphate acyltransferase